MNQDWMRSLALAAGILLAAAGSPGAQEREAEDLYYQAWHAETGERNPEKALGLYRTVLERFAAAEETAAKAQFQIATCQEKLGRHEEARASYQSVITRFAGQRDLVAKAEARLRALPAVQPARGVDGAGGPAAVEAAADPLLSELASAEAAVRDAAYPKLLARGTAGLPALHEALSSIADEKARARARFCLEAAAQGLVETADLDVWMRVNGTQLDLDFQDTPIDEVFAFVRDLTGLNIILEALPGAAEEGPTVTFRVKDLSLYSSIKLMCGLHGRVPVIHEGALVITSAERAAELQRLSEVRAGHARPAPPAAGAVQQTLDRLKIALNFLDAPLPDVIEFLRQMSGLNFLIRPEVMSSPIAAKGISLQVRDLTLGRTLRLLCDTNGLSYEIVEEVVVISLKR